MRKLSGRNFPRLNRVDLQPSDEGADDFEEFILLLKLSPVADSGAAASLRGIWVAQSHVSRDAASC